MQNTNWVTWALLTYLIIFIFGVPALLVWRAKRRQERPPLAFKLLRGPGESLRRRVTTFEAWGLLKVTAAGLIPLGVAIVALQILIWFAPKTPFQLGLGLGLAALATLVAIFFAGRWCYRLLNRYRNDALGYLGERVVGEALDALNRQGFRVFHDVPAEANGTKFNIDHVAIGENGVFAIETKTRRKGRTRPGFEAHKVAYDGTQLIWPWSEDTYGLDNARDRALWLGNWLHQRTGLKLNPQPVLALPGWYVVPQGTGAVLVLNHKQLAPTIVRADASRLTPAQIDLISRQLDDLCRDVED